MKGRRKVKTCKWFLKAESVVEAEHMFACRSKKAAHRFPDTASQFKAEYVSIGRIARGSSSLKPVHNHLLAWCSASKASLKGIDETRRIIQEREREMVSRAKAHILTCGDFLRLQDLSNHLGIYVELLSPALQEWEADHRIFSINHDGLRFYPVYAFPAQGGASPIPGFKNVLSALRPAKDGWSVSFWFISPNGLLGGKRPQDLLSTEPSCVISAAHDEAIGVTHG